MSDVDALGLFIVLTVAGVVFAIGAYLTDKWADRTKPTLPNPQPRIIIRNRRYW